MTEHKQRLETLVHGIALAVLLGWVLYVARDVLVPVAYSALLVYVVLGMTRQMTRIPRLGPRLPAALRYGVSAAVILAAVWGLTLLVLASISEIAANAARYDQATLGAIQRAAAWLGIETEPTWPQLRQLLFERVNLTRLLGSTAGVMLGLVGTLAVVVIYAIFLLIEKRAFDGKIDRLYADPGRAKRLRTVIHSINDRVGNYLALKTLLGVRLGALLAVPFAAIMLIVFQEFEGTRPLAVLLSRHGQLDEDGA